MQPKKDVKKDESKEAEAPKTKPTKKEALKEAARTSEKITAWLRPKTKEVDMDWFDDKDVPSGEEIADIAG